VVFSAATLQIKRTGKAKLLSSQCSEFVRVQREPVVQQIRDCKTHLDHLTEQLETRVAGEKIPHGLGALTVSLPDGEVCDWNRFKHRNAVGSYTGGCPSDTVRAACNGLVPSTGMATKRCAGCWSKRSGDY
jgi:hypothetical protein